MVESEKQGFRVAGEEKIEENHGRYDSNKEGRKREMVAELQVTVDGDSEKASKSIVDRPDGEEKVTHLALVGISASGAAIERGEIVAQTADAQQGEKHGPGATLGTFQEAGSSEVGPSAVEIVVHQDKGWVVFSMRGNSGGEA